MATTSKPTTQLATDAAYPSDWNAGMAYLDDQTNQQVIKLVGQGSSNGKFVITALYNFLDKMDPKKPQSSTTGAANQLALQRALKVLFNNVTDDFDNVMTAALAIFQAGSQGTDRVWSDNYAQRFISSISALSANTATAFVHWIHFMILMSDSKARAATLKQYKLSTIFNTTDISEPGKARIYNYLYK